MSASLTKYEPSDRTRRFAGFCGLAGALLFFAGDMLFYGHFGSGANFSEGMRITVLQASNTRLFAGGLVAPVAACLCIVGFWHVFLNVRPSSVLPGRIMLVCFFALMVTGSAVHTLWTAKGLALKYCYGQGSPCPDLLSATRAYWTLAYNMGAIPGYIGGVILLVLVVAGKSWYPRWTAVVNPGVLILLSPPAAKIPPPLGSVLVGGSDNLSIVFFFLFSIATTWTRPAPATR